MWFDKLKTYVHKQRQLKYIINYMNYSQPNSQVTQITLTNTNQLTNQSPNTPPIIF